MFSHPTSRPSTGQPSERASAVPRTLTPAQTELAVFRFQTLEELDIRFADFLDRAQFVLGHSLDSRRGYKGTYGNFRNFLRSRQEVPLPEKLCDIEGWLAWNRKRTAMEGRPLSKVTLNTYYRQLRPFFHDLEYRDGIPNPFLSVPPPHLPRIQTPKARTFEECQHILATTEHLDWPSPFERWRALAIIATFIYAGLRKREVLRLAFGDVNLIGTKGIGTLQILDGKGGTDRVVTVAPELRMILARYVAERGRIFPHPSRPAGPAFFTSTQTVQGISESTLRRIAGTVRRASGIPFSMHSLRHAFITTLLNTGTAIHKAQILAGHKKITTTAMYLAATDDDLREAVQKLSFRGPRRR
jgi:site-specific recombinase XerD